MSLRLDEIVSRAGWNGFVGWIWPAGRSLETLQYTMVILKLSSFGWVLLTAALIYLRKASNITTRHIFSTPKTPLLYDYEIATHKHHFD